MKPTILAQAMADNFCKSVRNIDFIDKRTEVTEAFARFLASGDNPEDAEGALRLALVSKLKRASLEDIIDRAGEILNWKPPEEKPKLQPTVRKKKGRRKPRF